MGSPGSSGSLLKASIDIEIFFTYKEYFLLLRFQKKFLSLVQKEHFNPSQIVSHISGKGGKKNLFSL
jgi:hypothetical protein